MITCELKNNSQGQCDVYVQGVHVGKASCPSFSLSPNTVATRAMQNMSELNGGNKHRSHVSDARLVGESIVFSL